MDRQPFVAIEDLGIQDSSSQHWLIQGLDLRVEPGECCALVGPRHAGKTVALEALLGLRTVTTGRIRIGASTNVRSIRQHSTVAWRSCPVDGALSVRRNIESVLALAGSPIPTPREIRSVLRLVEIPDDLIDTAAANLSSSQQLFSWLAIALLRRSTLLIIDDPTATWSALEVHDATSLLRDLRRNGLTMLVATRDTDFACAIADRICVIEDGCKVADGAPGIVFGGATAERLPAMAVETHG